VHPGSGRLKTFPSSTLLCTGREEGADLQGRGLAGLWFPTTFSAGEVGSATQRLSDSALPHHGCCSDLRCVLRLRRRSLLIQRFVPRLRCCILQQEGLLQLAAGATSCTVAHEMGSTLITTLVDYQEHTKYRSFQTSAIFKPTNPRETGSR
jgi:hypothetical protein